MSPTHIWMLPKSRFTSLVNDQGGCIRHLVESQGQYSSFEFVGIVWLAQISILCYVLIIWPDDHVP